MIFIIIGLLALRYEVQRAVFVNSGSTRHMARAGEQIQRFRFPFILWGWKKEMGRINAAR